MPCIKKLKPEEAQKIAAGEVVERPVNVVKELLENALDAGATRIQISIEDGGKKLIRVIDNGHGMSREDAHLCFEHHATSKLELVTDLPGISTFGFRGEALSSIASVSQVALVTRTAEQETACSLQREGGEVTTKSDVAHAVGTDISIKNIFFNVPARHKFLKKRETEWRQIYTLVHACALSNLTTEFSLYSEKKRILFCPAATSLAERIAQVNALSFGTTPLIFEEQTHRGVTLYGCISNHQHGRYDRSQIFLFVNKRWVKNTQLSRALLKGYDNVLQPGRFPAAIISITVDPYEVDINTHPRKEEVTFLHPRHIETALTKAVRTRLEQGLSEQIRKPVSLSNTPVNMPNHRPSSHAAPLTHFPPPYVLQPKQSSSPSRANPPALHANMSSRDSATSSQQTPSTEEPQTIPDVDNTYRLIGQLKKTYILLEQTDGLFLVDQHAAHERILYEQFCKRFEEAATVALLFPQQITLSEEDIALIEPHLSLLHEHGIQIEPFSQNQLIIQATPVPLKTVQLEPLIKLYIGWIREHKQHTPDEFIKELHFKLRAQMACKAAVKAGDELSVAHMQQLLDDLHTVQHRFTCPHGRPTGWLLHQYDIEKKFKRKV